MSAAWMARPGAPSRLPPARARPALLASALLAAAGAWSRATEPAAFAAAQPCSRAPRVACGAGEENPWKEVLEAERGRSELLLMQLEEVKELVAKTRIGEEIEKAQSIYEECTVNYGQSEYENLKACNDRLQLALKGLQAAAAGEAAATPAVPTQGEAATGRLEGIGVAVEILQPVPESDEFALVANAPHVRVSLPLGLRGLMWGSDLTPLFDEAGDRLMAIIADIPLGVKLTAVPRPPEAIQAPGDLIMVQSVSPASEASLAGILPGDYIRAVSYMGRGEEPGFIDKMLGAEAAFQPKVAKVDGMSAEEVDELISTNKDWPDGMTILLERKP